MVVGVVQREGCSSVKRVDPSVSSEGGNSDLGSSRIRRSVLSRPPLILHLQMMNSIHFVWFNASATKFLDKECTKRSLILAPQLQCC